MNTHPVWLALMTLALFWYSTVTIFVAVKGISDIRGMLRRLEENVDESD